MGTAPAALESTSSAVPRLLTGNPQGRGADSSRQQPQHPSGTRAVRRGDAGGCSPAGGQVGGRGRAQPSELAAESRRCLGASPALTRATQPAHGRAAACQPPGEVRAAGLGSSSRWEVSTFQVNWFIYSVVYVNSLMYLGYQNGCSLQLAKAASLPKAIQPPRSRSCYSCSSAVPENTRHSPHRGVQPWCV